MRINIDELKRMIRLTLLEEEIRLAQDSVDDQIDSILLKYESDVMVDKSNDDTQTSQPKYAEGLINLSGLDVLYEAPDDKDDEKPTDDEDEDTGDDGDNKDGGKKDEPLDLEPSDIDDKEPDVESDPLTPKIDISRFAQHVARLVTEFSNLLDVPLVIATRAYNQLVNNYGEAVAQEFADVMSQRFSIDVNVKSTSEPETLPIAVGAGASGLGGV